MIRYLVPPATLFAVLMAVSAAIIYAPAVLDARVMVDSDGLDIDQGTTDLVNPRDLQEMLNRIIQLDMQRRWATGERGYLRGRCAPWGWSERTLCIWDEAAI